MNDSKKESTPFFQNLSILVKKGSNTIKEKIGGLFTKKEAVQSLGKANSHFPKSPVNENKNFFKIEEDEDGKEKCYYIEEEEEEVEDEEDTVEEQTASEGKKVEINKEEKEDKTNTSTKTNSSYTEDPSDTELDANTVSHRIYYKGSHVDITQLSTVRVTKIKEKSGIMSFIGLSKKIEEKEYFAYFDENYIYMIKDVQVCKEDRNLRRIGNKYNLKLFHNAYIENTEHEGKSFIHISLEFFKENNLEDSILKDLYLNEQNAQIFVDLFNSYLKRHDIQLYEEGRNQHNENEINIKNGEEKEINNEI